MRSRFIGAGLLTVLGGCGPGPEGTASHSTTIMSSSESAAEGDPESSSEDTDPPSQSETESETESETGCDWDRDSDSDWGGPDATCDIIWQDCPEGEKCVPYASFASVGGSWDNFKCVVVDGEGGPGEPCVSEGPLLARDDCNATSFCAGYDENLLGGVCHPYCTGTLEIPECIAGWGCAIPDEDPRLCELPAYCVRRCDPLISDCEAGSICAWADSTLRCIDEGAGVPAGQPCEAANDCGAGLACLNPELLAGCTADGCCTPYCSVMAGHGPCQAIDPSYICEPFFGQAPLGYEDLGVCVVPR